MNNTTRVHQKDDGVNETFVHNEQQYSFCPLQTVLCSSTLDNVNPLL